MAKGTKIPVKALTNGDVVRIKTPSGLELRGTMGDMEHDLPGGDSKALMNGTLVFIPLGSKVRLISEARKPLPDEPGVYRPASTEKPMELLFRLDTTGAWWRVNRFLTGGTWQRTTAENVQGFMDSRPLIRLPDPKPRSVMIDEIIEQVTEKLAARGDYPMSVSAIKSMHKNGEFQ